MMRFSYAALGILTATLLTACADLGTTGPGGPWSGGDADNIGNPQTGNNAASGTNRLSSEPGGFDAMGGGRVTGWRIEGSGRVTPELPGAGAGGTYRGGGVANER